VSSVRKPVSDSDFSKRLKAAYDNRYQLEFKVMGKSFTDWLDVADSAMDGIESALIQPKASKTIDMGEDGSATVDWNEPIWADCMGTHHRFSSRTSNHPCCGLAMKESDIGHRRVLEHGKRIVVCTSCVIGVGK
jgi:predicted transcriptional regulator